MARRRKRSKKVQEAPMASTADKYALYESAVYQPEADYEFLNRVYRHARGRKPKRLREDFAGTAQLAALWVANGRDAEAWAVDLDPEPLEWGRARHVEPLGKRAERVHLLEEDVLKADTPAVDVVTAFNFSYWILDERKTLLKYFRRVLDTLDDDGMFVMDVMGGPGAQSETEEERDEDGFVYVWEQEAMDAITHHMQCHIHFEFEDGSRMDNAFDYHWRLWSLAEIRDVLLDAGFHRVDAYWEGTDEDGEGDGNFRKKKHAENEETYIAYLVAWKSKSP